MNTDQLLEQLQRQGELLAAAAQRANLQAAVPSCPGWTTAAAVGHLAKVHSWAAWIVRGGDRENFHYERAADSDLLESYRLGLSDLVATLRSAPDTLAVSTLWSSDSSKHFWTRRQAHETAIHRVDVELAMGFGVSDFEPEFAADGLDELLMGMAPQTFVRTGLTRMQTVVVTPLDANVSWSVRFGPDGVGAKREAADQADLNVFGLSSELYRWAWNRAGDDEVSLRGDVTIADLWRTNFTVGARCG